MNAMYPSMFELKFVENTISISVFVKLHSFIHTYRYYRFSYYIYVYLLISILYYFGSLWSGIGGGESGAPLVTRLKRLDLRI